jgi:uncharacterized protein (TIGR03437 family)
MHADRNELSQEQFGSIMFLMDLRRMAYTVLCKSAVESFSRPNGPCMEVLPFMKRSLTFSLLIISLFALGSASALSGQSLIVDKPAVTLSGQFGGTAVSQTVNITSTGASIPITLVVPPGTQYGWLKINGQTTFSGNTPSAVTVTADPTGLNAGTYTANISVITGSTTASPIQVTFTVSSIGVSPSSVTLSYTVGSNVFPAAYGLTLSGPATACSATVAFTGSGNWFSLLQNSCASPGNLSILPNTSVISGLAAGTYTATVTITPTPAAGSPAVVVPITLTVLPTPPVTVNPTALTFNWQTGVSAANPNQTFTISTTSVQPITYTVSGSTNAGNWISTISPQSGMLSASSGAQITLTLNPAGLAAGTYTGSLVVSTPGGTPGQTTIPITLIVSATPLLNVPNATLTFTSQLGASAPAAQSVNITATSGNLVYTVSQSANSSWLTVPTAGVTTTPLPVSVNTTGLNVGTYNAIITIGYSTTGGMTQTIPVVLTITNSPTVSANVASLSFPYQIGQTVPPAQTVQVSSTTGVPLFYNTTYATTTCGNGWLPVGGPIAGVGQNSANYTLTVPVVTTGLAAGTCTGTITISAIDPSTNVAAVNSPLSIPVTLYVSNTPLLVVTPATPVLFNVGVGAASPAAQSVTLTSTSSTVLNYTVAFQTNNGGNWLYINAQSGSTASNNTLSIGVISNNLAAGTYTGSVTVTATGPGGSSVPNSPIVIPVTVVVTAGSLTIGTNSLSFQQTAGGSAPPAQSVLIGSTSQPLNYTAVANVGGNAVSWLTVSPASGNTATNGTLTISADGSKLIAGAAYTGTIIVTAPGAGNSPSTINVSLTVAAGTISAATTPLTFTQVQGGAAPATQTIAVTGSPTPLNFTVVTSASSPWLSATPLTGTTPGTIQVSVNGSAMAVAQYTGSVTITSGGATGSPITVPVVLNVVPAATLAASPTSLAFTYTSGQTVPPAQNIAITASSTAVAVNLAAQVQPASATAWLTVTPTTATAPATFAVAVSPTGLAAGNYSASVVINSANAMAPLTVGVTLTVGQIPTPVVSAIGNAANYATGAVSPGENIVIFGSGIGPATLAHATVANNAFPTTVGLTQVLFDGVAAPVIYASAGQTSVMVPYGVAGRTTTSIVVSYSGVSSNPLTYNVVAAAPGIYTQNQQGTGPGSILNQDGMTQNTSTKPESRGNIISVYMTGEGQTSPAGVDGMLATTLKSPVLPVTATIGGVPATVVYAGSAPGEVYGIMQVNLQIPLTVTPGAALPVVVSVGTFASQSGAGAATVSVQ